MSQIDAAQNAPAQALADEIIVDDSFETALASPGTRFNVIVEVLAFRNDAVAATFGFMVDMGFAGQTLPDDPDAVPSTIPDNILLRFSSRILNWRFDDELAPNEVAEVRLATRSNVESSVDLSPTSDSGGVTNVGSVIVNDRDYYVSDLLAEYNFGGRLSRILWGPADHPRKDYRVLIYTYAANWERSAKGVATLRLQDQRFRLDVPFQSRVFGGTGALDGTSDLYGIKRPRLIGFRRHLEPRVIDSTTGLRMINDGPIVGVLQGYMGGEPVDSAGDFASLIALQDAFDDDVIQAGQYGTCNALGVVLPKFGVSESVFTVSAIGDRSITDSDRPGDLIIAELQRAQVRSYEIDVPAFEFMTGSAGYYFDGNGDSPTIRQIVESLALSGGGRVVSDLKFTAIRLLDPSDNTYDDEYIDEEIEDLEYRGPVALPVLKFEVQYNFNDRVLSDAEILLPDQNSAIKATLKTPYDILGQDSAYTQFRYKDYTALITKQVLLNNIESAAALEVQLRKFYGQERHVWRCRLPARAMRRSVGSILKFTKRKHKIFNGGRNVLLVANDRQLETINSLVHVVV